ncbi:MAG: outer membrane lipoprotein carrier protein LolA [Defluviicoccus sp.]|nr:outer membrane lipoprotein carrier protein LolA [Defluviicoccus sp.]MDG4592048.1 outer membrane lipoprotein carrier protein LolA [Defluviicoccus sp.]
MTAIRNLRPLAALLLVCAWLLTPLPAAAAIDRAQLERIERYLNAITTVEARFVQIASTGEVAEGTLALARPGRLRLAYAPPSPILVIANGTWLIYSDSALEQVSYLPIGSTPASILLADRIKLDGGDLSVTAAEAGPGTVRVSLVRRSSPSDGTLTLVFADQPLTLTQWQVTDAQGITTTVRLLDARFGGTLSDKLFRFDDPRFWEEKLRD